MRGSKPILLVEDDVVDAMGVKRSFKKLNITNELIILNNGVEAIEFLHDTNNNRPCIILLDLQMPKMYWHS
ncbi:MAG: hypothetical protein ACXAC7_19550 [Candidatus Hodarchaeales archaeon]|jgi:CheY-like chemotaxis protein